MTDPLTSSTKPKTDATLTIRIVKSFEYRTQKALVLQHVDLMNETVGGLMDRCIQEIKTKAGFKPFRNLELDTLKLYTQAHGHKAMNLIINLDHEEWILDDHSKLLADIGAQNETEFSLFNRAEYEAFKLHPDVLKWD